MEISNHIKSAFTINNADNKPSTVGILPSTKPPLHSRTKSLIETKPNPRLPKSKKTTRQKRLEKATLNIFDVEKDNPLKLTEKRLSKFNELNSHLTKSVKTKVSNVLNDVKDTVWEPIDFLGEIEEPGEVVRVKDLVFGEEGEIQSEKSGHLITEQVDNEVYDEYVDSEIYNDKVENEINDDKVENEINDNNVDSRVYSDRIEYPNSSGEMNNTSENNVILVRDILGDNDNDLIDLHSGIHDYSGDSIPMIKSTEPSVPTLRKKSTESCISLTTPDVEPIDNGFRNFEKHIEKNKSIKMSEKIEDHKVTTNASHISEEITPEPSLQTIKQESSKEYFNYASSSGSFDKKVQIIKSERKGNKPEEKKTSVPSITLHNSPLTLKETNYLDSKYIEPTEVVDMFMTVLDKHRKIKQALKKRRLKDAEVSTENTVVNCGETCLKKEVNVPGNMPSEIPTHNIRIIPNVDDDIITDKTAEMSTSIKSASNKVILTSDSVNELPEKTVDSPYQPLYSDSVNKQETHVESSTIQTRVYTAYTEPHLSADKKEEVIDSNQSNKTVNDGLDRDNSIISQKDNTSLSSDCNNIPRTCNSISQNCNTSISPKNNNTPLNSECNFTNVYFAWKIKWPSPLLIHNTPDRPKILLLINKILSSIYDEEHFTFEIDELHCDNNGQIFNILYHFNIDNFNYNLLYKFILQFCKFLQEDVLIDLSFLQHFINLEIDYIKNTLKILTDEMMCNFSKKKFKEMVEYSHGKFTQIDRCILHYSKLLGNSCTRRKNPRNATIMREHESDDIGYKKNVGDAKHEVQESLDDHTRGDDANFRFQQNLYDTTNYSQSQDDTKNTYHKYTNDTNHDGPHENTINRDNHSLFNSNDNLISASSSSISSIEPTNVEQSTSQVVEEFVNSTHRRSIEGRVFEDISHHWEGIERRQLLRNR